MRSTFLATAICTGFTLGYVATAVAADKYISETKGFEVTVPDGWSQSPSDKAPVDLILLSPRLATTRGLCLLLSQQVEATRKMTQAQLNDVLKEQANEAFWKAIVSDDPVGGQIIKDVKIDTKQEMREGRAVSRATATVTATKAGEPDLPLQLELMLQAVPGQSYMTQCVVLQAQVATEAADIKLVIDTHRATGPGVIAKLDLPPGQGAVPLAQQRTVGAAARDALKAGMAELLKRAAARR